MLAKGILDVVKTPYFHFQEYKPYKIRRAIQWLNC